MTTRLTAEMLGERLRRAREARGLSQQEVAKHLGLKNHQPVLRMESGQREVSTIELAELARRYRRPLSYFVTPEAAETEEADYAVLFRAGGLTDKNLGEVHRLLERYKEFALLSRALGLVTGTAANARLEYPTPRDRSEAIAQGERMAADARKILGKDEEEPIDDLTDLLEHQGIGVFLARLPKNISGLCVGGKAVGRCIIVNDGERASRNTFTIAHELCHLLVGETAHICYEESGRDPNEIRADQFAAALLMPAAGLESFRRDSLGVAWNDLNALQVSELQFHFKVSYEAMVVRLRQQRLISEAHAGKLKEAPSERIAALLGHDEKREMRRPPAFERRLKALALEAFRLGKLSRGKLAEITDLDHDELNQLLRDVGIKEPAVQRRQARANPLLKAAGTPT